MVSSHGYVWISANDNSGSVHDLLGSTFTFYNNIPSFALK